MSRQQSSATLLDVDESLLTRKLLLEEDPFNVEPTALTQLLPEASPNSTTRAIKPLPGVCVKARLVKDGSKDGVKVFLNLCTSEDIPAPPDVSAKELMEILDSEDTSSFRIPMSIGPPHQEKDKSGEPCTAYDIVVNPSFLNKAKGDPLFHNFFIIATMESVEEKYDQQLDKQNWTVLKNKQYYGTAPSQVIKTAMPLVMELASGSVKPGTARAQDNTQRSSRLIQPCSTGDSNNMEDVKASTGSRVLEQEGNRHARHLSAVTSKHLSDEGKETKRRPDCVVRRLMSPTDSSGSHETQHIIAVTAHVKLPGLSSGAAVSVLVGEDRVVLDTDLHFLDLLLPCCMCPEGATAHFITDTQTMMIRVPVQAC